jgi:hypothetical protein
MEQPTQIQIPLDEAIRVFRFLERANDLMHQPMGYQDPQQVEAFVEANYPELRELYYRIVWNWLPAQAKARIEKGEDDSRD